MPYIKQERRESMWEADDLNMGDVNYVISSTLAEYLKLKGTSYEVINDLIGMLECCKLELYRRIAAPYEDEKIKENGDVY